jgi:LAO/AO transport system kinase
MTRYVPSLELVPRIAAGESAAIARLMSRAEAGSEEAREALAEVYRRAGRAQVIGVTGVPGSGKSTLVARIVRLLRDGGAKIGIIAVDPSSPYSGGAILGDRIRMSELSLDAGVFIRSMATRGAVGGIARAALGAVDILDAAGFDTIIIETVGVGQDEVEIAKASDTALVVSAPGLGDEIQAIKAGILEIADIHVVSKSDRSDANRTLADLKQMLALGTPALAKAEWSVPVIGCSSFSGEGIEEVVNALRRHREASRHSDLGARRRVRIAEFRLQKTAENLLAQRFAQASASIAPAMAARLLERRTDPYSLAAELVAAALKEEPDERIGA